MESIFAKLISVLASLSLLVSGYISNLNQLATPTVSINQSDGLVGYWKFDEISGIIASDSSGNGNNGTLTNGPVWTSGKFGGALQLDGIDDYVNIPVSPSITSLSNITLSVWLKPNQKEINGIFGCINGENSSSDSFIFVDNVGSERISSSIRINNTVNTRTINTTVGSGSWNHLVYSYDGNSEKIYWNGIEVGSFLKTGLLHNNTECGLYLGRTSTVGNYFTGLLDEVRIYNRAISAEEVLNIYNNNAYGQDKTTSTSSNINTTTTPTAGYQPDITSLIISGVSAKNITSSSANISWITNKNSDSQVEYGTTTTYGQHITLSTSFVTDHNVSLTGLSPNTLYNYRVKSKDSSGNLFSVSPNFSFVTSPAVSSVSTSSISTSIALTSTLSPSGNGIVITNTSGVRQINYPIQIGRPFVEGHIPNFPQAVVAGTPVFTQADVKSRWGNGSVKHSIISFILSNIEPGQSINVNFQNQTTSNNTPLTKEEMLDPKYNFDAVMELTNGEITKKVSARTMLQNGDYEYWTQGPISTTIILKDHSLARKYDIGFNSYRPFRPIFHASFWPVNNNVRVRYIGEASNSEELTDNIYSLVLKIGFTNPRVVYNKGSFMHHAGSRWTKEFWKDNFTDIKIDHNTPYLISSKFLPNYDMNKKLSEIGITSYYNNFLSKPKDINDSNNFITGMGSGGGRPDIGPYPGWIVKWLYSFDNRMKEMSVVHSELAGAYPMNFRENDPTKFLDKSNSIPGIGLPISIYNRPTLVLNDGNVSINFYGTNANDKLNVVNSCVRPPTGMPNPYNCVSDTGLSNNFWAGDNAHQPDPFSVLYTLTGDYWHLEQMKFWVSWGAARDNGAARTAHNGRGPTGAEGGLRGFQIVRANAWPLRNRVHAVLILPDDDPFKSYTQNLINDTIAIWEGEHLITGTRFENTNNWNWGKNIGINNYKATSNNPVLTGPSPLGFWSGGIDDARYYEQIDSTKVKSGQSMWMQDYLLFALGRAKELGQPTGPLLSWVAKARINQINEPTFDRNQIAAFATPVSSRITGQYFTTWAEVAQGMNSNFNFDNYFTSHYGDLEHGYPYILAMAMAYAADEPNGFNAWKWAAERVFCNPNLSNNPKWVIIPRGQNLNCTGLSSTVITSTTSIYTTSASVPVTSTITPTLSQVTSAYTNTTPISSIQNTSLTETQTSKIQPQAISEVTLSGQIPTFQTSIRGGDSNVNSTPKINKLMSNLYVGKSGVDVLNLQTFLVYKGYLQTDSITGFFGIKTENAVKNFQKDYGIVSSGSPNTTGFGVVGPRTILKINSLLEGSINASSGGSSNVILTKSTITSDLKRGSRGDEVLLLQSILVKENLFDISNQTGFFGQLTENAVKNFQVRYNIVSSGTPNTTGFGLVGPRTRIKLNELLR